MRQAFVAFLLNTLLKEVTLLKLGRTTAHAPMFLLLRTVSASSSKKEVLLRVGKCF
jgi:hypothetical protein